MGKIGKVTPQQAALAITEILLQRRIIAKNNSRCVGDGKSGACIVENTGEFLFRFFNDFFGKKAFDFRLDARSEGIQRLKNGGLIFNGGIMQRNQQAERVPAYRKKRNA